MALVLSAPLLQPPAGASAQEAVATPAEAPPKTQTDVTDEDLSTTAAPTEAAVPQVQEGAEQAEAAVEVGIPSNFTIEFGDTDDWIQFKKGEWLRGELMWMRQEEAEFDSKKLKRKEFKWADIVQLYAPGIKTYVFEERIAVTGRAMVTKEQVIIETVEGVKVVFPRDKLISILYGEPRERNYWSTRLRAGFSGTAGNSEQLSLNAFWQLERSDQLTDAVISYEGTFASAARKETANRHLGEFDLRVYVRRRVFITPIMGQLLNDRFQNLRLRATPTAGAGAYIFDASPIKWYAEGGLGYQFTNFLSTAAGIRNEQHDGLLLAHTYFKWTFVPDNSLELDWRTNLVYTNIGLTNHIGAAKLKLKVVSILDFETAFTFFRTERPPPRADGTAPKRNDYQVVVGLLLTINE